MQINVNAVFLLNHALFALPTPSKQACVIHTSSSVGREGRAYWGAYAASKFALEGLSQVFADETEVAGRIKVFSVNPGRHANCTARRAAHLKILSLPTPEARMELLRCCKTRWTRAEQLGSL